MNDQLFLDLANAVADGETDEALKFVNEALDQKISPLDILEYGANKGLEIVNERYNSGNAFLPELVMAGDTMTEIVDLISNEMKKSDQAPQKLGKVVIGQAQGDVHDIGKNIVVALLSVNGFDVYDLGTDVSVKDFVEKAKEIDADIIGMSTLLTTSMPYLEDLIKYLEDMNMRDKFYCIFGGGPVTSDFAQKAGADGWSRTAFDAVSLCKQLIAGGCPPVMPSLLVEESA